MLLGKPVGTSGHPDRLRVFDLPSISEYRLRLLAVSALLESEFSRCRREWQKALSEDADKDVRVPTFIVLDEAHNLIPQDARNDAEKRVREQFQTIAAEGRKYGLFLSLVSQRPDKLDHRVISECANRAVMKLGSAAILNVTKESLGLEAVEKFHPETLKAVLNFKVGRALIHGPWAGAKPRILYGAMRRTEEGGRNLREEHWASRKLANHAPTLEKAEIGSAWGS
jgi:DNA helicase HerA-like ATPase